MDDRAGYASEWRKSSTARSASREYSSWIQMIGRCTKPRHPNFPQYGARGITVCARWMTYENFRADMGERPPGTSIDRIDNARGYEPSNCRWATHAEQQRNRSISKLKPEQVAEIKARYAAGGITQTALAREFGITSAMVSSVVNGQWWQGVGDVALNRQTVRLGAAKLTGEDVQKLRSRHAAGGISLSELAKQYGLSKSGVYGIVTRQRWSAANG